MKKKVLIVFDNSTRDLYPSKLLEKKMVELGVDARCCSKRDFIVNFRTFKPDGCVVPRGDWPMVKAISSSCKVFIMPSEGARLTPETMLSVFIGRLHPKSKGNKRLDQENNEIDNFDHISKVYLWGDQSKKFLMDSGFFKEEQLFVSGNSRLDIYRNSEKKKTKAFTIGVAFSAKSASMFDGNYEYAKNLFAIGEKSHLPLVPEGRNWEDYAWRDFAILRHMMNVIKGVIQQTDHKIILRVGPLENREDYTFLQEQFPNRVEVQKRSGQLIDFLQEIDCLLTCWSTTGIEAQLLGIPCIGIPFLIDMERLIDHVKPDANGFNTFLKCYHTPTSKEEVLELIEKCRNGELAPAKDQELFESFIKSVYNYPGETSATSKIAEDVVQEVANFKFIEQESYSEYISLPGIFEALLKLSVLPKVITSKLLFLSRKLRNFALDMKAGSYKANSAFFASKNEHVKRLVEITNLD